MEREFALFVTDGSLESATVCAIARQTHDVILVDAGGSGCGPHAREAISRQIGFARPRRAHVLGDVVKAPADDPGGLMWWTGVLGLLPPLIRDHGLRDVYLPLRTEAGGSAYGPAAEMLQIWEELYDHALGLGPVRLLAPLLEMESWQVVDLASQMGAPLIAAHGELEHAAFVRSGRAKP